MVNSAGTIQTANTHAEQNLHIRGLPDRTQSPRATPKEKKLRRERAFGKRADAMEKTASQLPQLVGQCQEPNTAPLGKQTTTYLQLKQHSRSLAALTRPLRHGLPYIRCKMHTERDLAYGETRVISPLRE